VRHHCIVLPHASADHRALHSSPTRRSSDLADQHAQAGRVDVTRLREVDQELARPALELLEHLLLQLLAVADNELTFDVDRDDVGLFLHVEVHGSLTWSWVPADIGRAGQVRCRLSPAQPARAAARRTPHASSAVMHATWTMSSTLAPRERSLQGRARPWMIGPNASARASRCTSLYAMFPASRSGKTSTFAVPASPTSAPFRVATAGISAASAWSSPSATTSGIRSRNRFRASRTRCTLSPVALPLV